MLTLQERKQARVDEIRAGYSRLRDGLVGYAREHGGRFWIYGSAATGDFHFESDIDILVDFDESAESAALDFVEREGSRLGLKVDVQPKRWCTPEFLDRVSPRSTVLP